MKLERITSNNKQLLYNTTQYYFRHLNFFTFSCQIIKDIILHNNAHFAEIVLASFMADPCAENADVLQRNAFTLIIDLTNKQRLFARENSAHIRFILYCEMPRDVIFRPV